MGLSFWHVILVLLIVLIFFGPSRLPGLGKSLGSAIKGFKDGLDGDEKNKNDKLNKGDDGQA